MPVFEISGNQFLYDGKPVRILSGAIHYFRVVPEYWRDRLLKLKACGFNTVETYVAWNIHEPRPDEFNFEGMADIVKFIEIAHELDLMVIVRPGPYICSEWEFGGLPSWLLADSNMRLRCYHKPFLKRVDKFFDELLPRLRPLLCTNGGPIIAMQVENEYGSYGNDKDYLNYLKKAMRDRGMDVLLFTSDGPTDGMLQSGTLEDVFMTANFGSRPEEDFAKLKEYQPDKPLVCMEYWNGWFDHWGGKHHTRDGADVADVLDRMLKMGASVNFYMFHGGTNFGFYNGANRYEKYTPTVTSYDYDAPLSECGDPTDKYYAVQEVLSKYVDVDKDLMPEPIPKKAYGRLELTETASLCHNLDRLSKPVKTACPEPMEKLGQDYGFILYSTNIPGPRKDNQLFIQDVHDRALIFVDGEFKGIYMRDEPQDITFDIPEEGVKLDILVENLGRVNYGPHLKDYKGITEGVRLGNQFLFGWTIYTLPLKDLSPLKYQGQKKDKLPAFFRGYLEVDEPADTFLSMEGWGKGVVLVNGFNLGRYWNIGPTKTLYIPAPLLKKGRNEIVVFELESLKEPVVDFLGNPDLG
ncbi:MAG: beta-galactosidase family protein [Caldicoprobacterales bacterium]|jgi:beta-galactosidase|nr:beta-galactosidase [Clostridiales bacterium]